MVDWDWDISPFWKEERLMIFDETYIYGISKQN